MKIIHIDPSPFHEIPYRSSGPQGIIRESVLPLYKVKVDTLPKNITAFAASSDLQGRELGGKNRLLGEVVAEELSLLAGMNEIPPVELILLAGDLYDYPDCRKMGGTGDVTEVFNAFARTTDAVVGVLGNHDIIEKKSLLSNISILDGTSTSYQDLKIGGVSGIIGKVSRNQRKELKQFMKALESVMTSKKDIILLHQGPSGSGKKQLGERVIREHLERHGAGIVISGHCHWSNPLVPIGNNQALNVDSRLFVFTV